MKQKLPADAESIAKPMGGENYSKKVCWTVSASCNFSSATQARRLIENFYIWKTQESVLQNTHLQHDS